MNLPIVCSSCTIANANVRVHFPLTTMNGISSNPACTACLISVTCLPLLSDSIFPLFVVSFHSLLRFFRQLFSPLFLARSPINAHTVSGTRKFVYSSLDKLHLLEGTSVSGQNFFEMLTKKFIPQSSGQPRSVVLFYIWD